MSYAVARSQKTSYASRTVAPWSADAYAVKATRPQYRYASLNDRDTF
jgi:hypothetical protein